MGRTFGIKVFTIFSVICSGETEPLHFNLDSTFDSDSDRTLILLCLTALLLKHGRKPSTLRMEFQKDLESSGLQSALVGDLISAEKCSWRKDGLALLHIHVENQIKY